MRAEDLDKAGLSTPAAAAILAMALGILATRDFHGPADMRRAAQMTFDALQNARTNKQ